MEATKTFTIDEYKKLKNVCYKNPHNEEYLLEDIEDYFDYLYEDYKEDEIEQSKNIPIYEKKYFKVDYDWLIELIQEYADDEYYMGEFDEQIKNPEILKQALEEFNDSQTWYTGGKFLGYLDISHEVEEYFKNL